MLARNWRSGSDWIPARVIEKLGPVMYALETFDHQCWKRHMDQLKGLTSNLPCSFPETETEEEPYVPMLPTETATRQSNDTTTVPMAESTRGARFRLPQSGECPTSPTCTEQSHTRIMLPSVPNRHYQSRV